MFFFCCLTSLSMPVCKSTLRVYVYAQSCPVLCDPMDWSPPGSSVCGIFQARILEWVAVAFSRESSQPRNQTGSPALQHCRQTLPSEPPGKIPWWTSPCLIQPRWMHWERFWDVVEQVVSLFWPFLNSTCWWWLISSMVFLIRTFVKQLMQMVTMVPGQGGRFQSVCFP